MQELPIGMWTNNFKEKMDLLLENKQIKSMELNLYKTIDLVNYHRNNMFFVQTYVCQSIDGVFYFNHFLYILII